MKKSIFDSKPIRKIKIKEDIDTEDFKYIKKKVHAVDENGVREMVYVYELENQDELVDGLGVENIPAPIIYKDTLEDFISYLVNEQGIDEVAKATDIAETLGKALVTGKVIPGRESTLVYEIYNSSIKDGVWTYSTDEYTRNTPAYTYCCLMELLVLFPSAIDSRR